MTRILVCGDFRAKDASKVVIERRLQEIIHSADYAVCNFEAPVGGGISIDKSGPVLNQDLTSAELLKNTGFNVILLANNHIMDYGREGAERTLEAFSDVTTVGLGMAKDAYQVKAIEHGGKRIGIMAFVQHEFGVIESLDDKKTFGTAWINSPDTEDVIREAKKNVDYLLIFPHCGVEHIDAPLPEWRERYKRLIRCGADAIVASHPHCQQGWEEYEGKKIYYSLGNFYFDELKHGQKWYKSLAVELEIDGSIKTREYCLQFDEEGKIELDESKESRAHTEKLCYLLENEEMYNDFINRVCHEEYENVKYNLMKGVGGFTPHIRFNYALRLLLLMLLGRKNEMTLLNLFQNESHRWLIERHLREKGGSALIRI